MTFLERLNRILVASLVGLVILQAGLLVLLKSLKDEADYRLVKNQTTQDISCERDLFAEKNYWDIKEKASMSTPACEEGDCAVSWAQWEQAGESTELHVVGVETPPPFYWENGPQGGVITVQVKRSENPMVLALVSRTSVEWELKLEPGARVQKVVIAAPTTVWLKGLAATVPIEYLPKEKMCSYPWTWEEAYNQDNDFRAMMSALRVVTGAKETSFQGARRGVAFTIPRQDNEFSAEATQNSAHTRNVASVQSSPAVWAQQLIPPKVAMGVSVWERGHGKVITSLSAHGREVLGADELPDNAKWVTSTHQGYVFAVLKGVLHTWSSEKKKFLPVDTPMTLPSTQNITALAYEASQGRLWVYNDERAGELYSYEIENSQWTLVHDGLSKNITALAVLPEQKQIVALVKRSHAFSELVYYSPQGKLLSTKKLLSPIAVDSLRWNWEMLVQSEGTKEPHFWLRLASVAHPQGEMLPLTAE